MAIQASRPGETINLLLGPALSSSKTTTLIKTESFEVMRLVLSAGKSTSTHQASGEITLQCLEGRVTLTAAGKVQEMGAGQLLYLAAAEPHAVKAIEDSSLLITRIATKKEPPKKMDVVEEASKESFPASDPPAHLPDP